MRLANPGCEPRIIQHAKTLTRVSKVIMGSNTTCQYSGSSALLAFSSQAKILKIYLMSNWMGDDGVIVRYKKSIKGYDHRPPHIKNLHRKLNSSIKVLLK